MTSSACTLELMLTCIHEFILFLLVNYYLGYGMLKEIGCQLWSGVGVRVETMRLDNLTRVPGLGHCLMIICWIDATSTLPQLEIFGSVVRVGGTYIHVYCERRAAHCIILLGRMFQQAKCKAL
jgi:hypothetical protein